MSPRLSIDHGSVHPLADEHKVPDSPPHTESHHPQRAGADQRVLITSGPTHEPIDEVRYIGNRSSGRMGAAIADAAARAGWRTTLLLGPTAVRPQDSRVSIERFRSTADLESLLAKHQPDCDLLIMAAAVADFRPADPEWSGQKKIRRRDGPTTLRLEPTPDLLAACAARRSPGQVLVGFALESREGLETAAREKLGAKDVDAIVANPLETMDAQMIEGTLIPRAGESSSPGGPLTKEKFGEWLVDRLAQTYYSAP